MSNQQSPPRPRTPLATKCQRRHTALVAPAARAAGKRLGDTYGGPPTHEVDTQHAALRRHAVAWPTRPLAHEAPAEWPFLTTRRLPEPSCPSADQNTSTSTSASRAAANIRRARVHS